jgi:hypothetical protein
MSYVWRKTHQKRVKANKHAFYVNNKSEQSLKRTVFKIFLKMTIVFVYSNGKMCCADPFQIHLVPYTNIMGLTVDHFKRTDFDYGQTLYAKLIKMNYPSGYQILCVNCNFLKYFIENNRNTDYKLKHDVLGHYANGIIKCRNCGIQDIRILSIDHMNKTGISGWKDRKRLGGSSTAFYRWLKSNNYPPGFQTLCLCCNFVKYERYTALAKYNIQALVVNLLMNWLQTSITPKFPTYKLINQIIGRQWFKQVSS